MENNEIYIEERLRNENLKIYMENDNIINIKLLQGSSFGFKHDTTTLAIKAIKKINNTKHNLDFALDFGSGSGVIAIFLKKLGIDKVFCCETDKFAVNESKKNFSVNNVNPIPDFIDNPFAQDQKYNVVIANISGSYIKNNLLEFSKIINNNGFLIISGFNCNKLDNYISTATNFSFKHHESFKKSPWASVILEKIS